MGICSRLFPVSSRLRSFRISSADGFGREPESHRGGGHTYVFPCATTDSYLCLAQREIRKLPEQP